jgi:hypothetical protein
MVFNRSNGINWRNGIATKLGVVIALAIAVAAIGWGWNYGLRQERTYEQEARQAHADQSKNSCYQVTKAEAQSPSVKKPDSKPCGPDEKAQQENDNRRDHADLVAQRSSALWAKIMGIAALIGMGLSFVGVALVWTTFREAKQANVIAAKAAHDQLRAYIVQHSGTAKRKRGAVGKIKIEATCIISNQGQTPAYDVLFSVQCFYQIAQPKHVSLAWDHTVPTVIGGGGRWQGQTTRDFTPDVKGKKRLYLLAEVRYRDHSGRKWVMYMASCSLGGSGRNLTQLVCCKEGNFESEIIETDG